ncbi:MAG TPA: LuxR C-terminal-related transcriptional regulator [Gaiellaceae bacterium]
MSARNQQSTTQTGARRIIERPRLIKLLDECEARIILLVAPAGYGKTTLARQWAKLLTHAVWVPCTPAHRDVVTFSEDVATGIDALGGDAAKFVREYLGAQSNPQRTAHRIGRMLAEQLNKAGVQWLIIDDYHELLESPESEQLVEALHSECDARLVVCSRVRPSWARSRRAMYGELDEIGRDALAMTTQEAAELLGPRAQRTELAQQAEGWPAVLALAASAKNATPPTAVFPNALYTYLAEEIFQGASLELQDQLVRLALLPQLTREHIGGYLGVDPAELIAEARELGFIGVEEAPELHPLLREFLLEKLGERPDADARVRAAIAYCVDTECWDCALQLIKRFAVDDLAEPVLQKAFKPLARSGRISTLASFATSIRLRATVSPPSVDVIEAEAAFRDGNIELASRLAAKARARLAQDHPLRPHACVVLGHCHFFLVELHAAESAFGEARATARDDEDRAEGLYGLAQVKIMGERAGARATLELLVEGRHQSATHLLRAITADLAHRRYGDGLVGPLGIDEGRHALPQVGDPRVRSSFAYLVAYTLMLKSQYRDAEEWLALLLEDVEAFELVFARPYAAWTAASIKLGLRRFGEAERWLQSVEDSAAASQDSRQQLNARILRARLLIETGKSAEAAELTAEDPGNHLFPAWRSEYNATHALALACSGQLVEAVVKADIARSDSHGIEALFLADAACAIAAAHRSDIQPAFALLTQAENVGIWDPVVCALRGSLELADGLASHPPSRGFLERLYVGSNDLGLARRAGFRTRATRAPDELLTPRESEVLGLIARGMKNRDIAQALYISQSTAKVHVRHVFEKLGVRTRSEAVARYERFNAE